MAEERPNGTPIEIKPLNEEEIKRGLVAIQELEQLGKRILARRKGKPLPPSWKLIRQAREDLSKRL
jgi:predicted ATP-binding protein involved in virulence